MIPIMSYINLSYYFTFLSVLVGLLDLCTGWLHTAKVGWPLRSEDELESHYYEVHVPTSDFNSMRSFAVGTQQEEERDWQRTQNV